MQALLFDTDTKTYIPNCTPGCTELIITESEAGLDSLSELCQGIIVTFDFRFDSL